MEGGCSCPIGMDFMPDVKIKRSKKPKKKKVEVVELKRGMTFRGDNGIKCHIANVFMEGDIEVITYRYWSKRRKRWFFKTDFKGLFLISFEMD